MRPLDCALKVRSLTIPLRSRRLWMLPTNGRWDLPSELLREVKYLRGEQFVRILAPCDLPRLRRLANAFGLNDCVRQTASGYYEIFIGSDLGAIA